MRHATLAAAALAATAAHGQSPTLTVYTYDSFVSEFGPGPEIETAFEAECDCDLDFVAAGDSATMLSRLKLEGGNTDADIVLGLDQNLMAAARKTGLFAPYHVGEVTLDVPVDWTSDLFLPFDWGHFAFVYDTDVVSDPPDSFRALADSDLDIIIQDPRSSTPGLGLLLWVKKAYGDEAAQIWKGLADNIVTVTKGWSESYGLFLDGEADMVLSWTSSPAYHMISEDDDTIRAAPFEEGHYIEIEIAGKLASTDSPDLADAFLDFMLSDGFQSAIPTAQWMYPAHTPSGGLPEAYQTLFKPEKTLLYPPDKVPEIRDAALAEWRAALSR